MISMTVEALEKMWAWIAFFCFDARGVSFLIYLTIPPKLLMVFRLVRVIILDAFGALRTA